MRSPSATSKSKSMPNKKKSRHQTARLISTTVVLLAVIGLAAAVFYLYDIFQRSFDVSGVEAESYSDFFDQQAIQALREIDKTKQQTELPSGSINPFY